MSRKSYWRDAVNKTDPNKLKGYGNQYTIYIFKLQAQSSSERHSKQSVTKHGKNKQ